MENKSAVLFAKTLSLIFHPLGMPLVIYILIRWIDPYYIAPAEADFFVFLLLFTNIVAPALSILIMMKFGMVSSIDLKERKERFAPYLLVIFYYFASYSLLRYYGPLLPMEVFSFFLSVLISLILSLSINAYWKISVHMLGQGGVFGSLVSLSILHRADVTIFIIAALIMASLTAYSRLKLNAHTPNQVYAGFCLGFICNVLVLGFKVFI
ncbi:MAG: phosphatase PAP2 family protein [Bacteroidota bacterium]|jgi:membrane-associated phospholipid phosphatase